MKLSKNLTLKEVTKSNTAIKNGIDNKPTPEHLTALIAIATNVFQPLRDYFAHAIHVSSGYRSRALNLIIGGSLTSQHSKGEALDLDADRYGGLTNYEIFTYIKDTLEFDQLIAEFPKNGRISWVHVSYKADGDNRGEILIALKNTKNKTYYVPYLGHEKLIKA